MNVNRAFFSRWLASFALLAGASAAALSCGDPSPVGADVSSDEQRVIRLKLAPGANGLVQCIPLAYDSVTQVIGPEGGQLNVGPHTLDVPAMALTDTVSITAVAPSDTVRWIRFKPEGLVFQRPASLIMRYKNCRTRGTASPGIALVSDSLEVETYLLSTADQSAKWVIGDLEHFSNYAVAW